MSKNKFVKIGVTIIIVLASNICFAQSFTNPIIHADYSDPDAIRVGDDYYMVSSSFTSVPGLPILHSKDLVHWKLIGHALQELVPKDYFSSVRHGAGVWAPSIRYHKNEFYIFYPDPDFGIYVIKSKTITGGWSPPKLIQKGKGLIDPCPLWDDNGKVYLAHAYAGSRAGIKSVIIIKELNANADSVISKPVLVYDGHLQDGTIEGPKLYKRNGYYYIFAPAGGVSTGWQTVLRSKNIYGPYERKIVMHQGKTIVNGPHQGAWVQDKKGNDFFIHFQDKEAYGRVVHLQPMQWKNNWPIIGSDEDGDGIGEPVSKINNIASSNNTKDFIVADSDEFNATQLGLQWQWQGNAAETWGYPTPDGYYQMFAYYQPDSILVWNYPNILSQKFPYETFDATLKFSFHPNIVNEKFGFTILGTSYAFLAVSKKEDGLVISYTECDNAEKGAKEITKQIEKSNTNELFFKIEVNKGAVCNFSYSVDGIKFTKIENSFTAKPGKWVGAKIGMFYTRNEKTNDGGFAKIDWIRFKQK
ncbi:MAG: glycoside hydrolase 43 family protein [Ferruginibacter sp.]|nr:glycoside hydrolase 43 family protein [Ferruginibacter sp.]